MNTIDAIRARLKAYEAAEVAHRERALARANGIFTEGSAPDTADAVMDTLGELHENAPSDIRHLLAALDAAQARADALADMLERVCVEFEGTHEHLQDIIDGNVTGVLAPIENYKRLKHDLAEMRQIDERAIAAARELMGGDV